MKDRFRDRVRRLSGIHAPVRAVLFDFDGTLTAPGSLDFGLIRREIGCPESEPVLEFIRGLDQRQKRQCALQILEDFESRAAEFSRPNDGAEQLLAFLLEKEISLGIVTRNSAKSVKRTLEHFSDVDLSDFSIVLTRDDDLRPKPDPESIRYAVDCLGIQPRELLTVGDYCFDIEAGRAAGVLTAFLSNGRTHSGLDPSPDLVVDNLAELQEILKFLVGLREGKLPNEFLLQFFQQSPDLPPDILVGPGMGEDVAAVRVSENERGLVLKSDPITFVDSNMGYYLVSVNVNDVVTSGATPRWLVTTLLFPPGTSAAQILHTMDDLERIADEADLALCGGHTEITSAVNRPVVMGHVTGVFQEGELLLKSSIRRGHQIIMTKRLAVEGTSVLAQEFREELARKGVQEELLRKAQDFLFNPGISVVSEARLACDTPGVVAMHDVTEGGVITALEEISQAGGHQIEVNLEAMPIYPETATICSLLGLDPLGLIGSGTLLIVCEGERVNHLQKKLQQEGIEAASIGLVMEPGYGLHAARGSGRKDALPHFERDELARILSER